MGDAFLERVLMEVQLTSGWCKYYSVGVLCNTSQFRYVPPKTYGPGGKRAVFKQVDDYPRIVDASRAPSYAPTSPEQKESVPIGYIDMPEGTTYGYWDAAYGVMNEAGLSMGESSCSGRLAAEPRSIVLISST